MWERDMPRFIRLVFFLLLLYAILCAVIGVFVAEGALHPQRRAITPKSEASVRQIALDKQSEFQDVSIPALGKITLEAWSIDPKKSNGNAVILLHGLGDNRLGMTGYAELLLNHGYNVLLPDARSHGASGGELATYGLLERDDIRRWFEWLITNQHPHCIFGLGESMGAAQLLQSLQTETGFCGVVAESSFSNFQEIAYDRVGQFFNAGPWVGRTVLRPVVSAAFYYARWKYGLNMLQVSPEDAVAQTKVPVLLIHGQIDSNIPVRHSRQIHSRNPATVLWEVPNADHCGAISTAPREFETRIVDWFQSRRP
jgi:pimeloyl-ACP methyl ester carboxylesterase